MNNKHSFVTMLLCLFAAVAFGADSTEHGMPQMGPPEQMKDLAFLEGTWDVSMQWRMSDTTQVWESSKGVDSFSYILGGAAMQGHYTGEAMGMPFAGTSIDSYDRETGMWQSMWIDNMASRVVLYTGSNEGNKWIRMGDDMYHGVSVKTRMITTVTSDKSFDWKMEMSQDGGKSFWITGKSTYTKR